MVDLAAEGVSKVAIPRLHRGRPPNEQKDEGPRKPRAGRACLNCRHRKVKCSGDTPRCSNCIASDLGCTYDQARRDRLLSATIRNKDLAQLLRELSLRVDDADRALIQEALEGYEDDSASAVSIKSIKRRKMTGPAQLEDGNETHPLTAARAPASLGSEGGMAHVDEDLLRSRKSRATGYVGQGAEVHWLRSLQDQMGIEKHDQNGEEGPGNVAATLERSRAAGTACLNASITDATFYLDSDSADLDIEVDPYELPPPEVAEKLLECYMETVHKSFPILPPQFEDQFQRYCRAIKLERPLSVPDRWLAIINVVFAIGAHYSHLIGAEWQGEERDHLVYMTRTIRLLGPWPFATTAPDLAMIQVTGLLSFYYQIIGHVSRGWVMIGIAIRLALALGLHLRNEDPKIPASRKETLLRTWWSLHAIECLLSAITGRPCVLSHEDCTVSLPQALSEEKLRSASPSGWVGLPHKERQSPTPASSSMPEKSRRLQQPRTYLDAHLNIGLITQKLLSALYSPRTAQRSWAYVQTTIPTLLRELDEWKQGALPEEQSLRTQIFPSPDGPREILLLRFYYFSTRILITRPCLCRFGRRIQDQSQSSAEFDQRMADECVEAALGLTKLLPSEPNPRQLYKNGPWWSIVHNIMQAMAVLLLELSYGEEPMKTRHSKIKDSVKRLLQWMRMMRTYDAVVVRAYKVVVNILKQGKFRTSAHNLLTEEDYTQEGIQHASSSLGHDSPRHKAHPSSSHAHRAPLPSEWYGAHYPDQSRSANAGFNPAAADPQLGTGLGRPQLQQLHEESMTQPNQPQPQAEQFQFLEDPFSNPYIFANPFITNFDQDQPFGLDLDDLWPQGVSLGNEDLAQQQNFDSQNYPYMVDQHQQK